MKIRSNAWAQPLLVCLPLSLTLPLFAACGSDEHLPLSPSDGGATSAGSAGHNSSHAGSPASDAGTGGVAGEGGEALADAGASGSGVGGPSAGDGGTAGSNLDQPPSCRAGGQTLKCGVNEESCCTSLPLPGQTFYRSYDAVTPSYESQEFPASVTGFRLDKFEVSVGRFRQFVTAVLGAWRPSAGDGKHTQLNDGKGLVNVGAEGSNELGWNEAWNGQLATKAADWNTHLACDPASASWTAKAGSQELLPISCVNWYEAYAFCIWDEAFLPSEAEWNDAASAGAQQRVYPWSSPPSSQNIDCLHANYRGKSSANGPDFCVTPGTGSVAPVGAQSPLGDGSWGHADLAGNVYEWTLDSFAPYTNACPDCVNSDALSNKVMRGGGYGNDSAAQVVSARNANAPSARSTSLGIRCARLP